MNVRNLMGSPGLQGNTAELCKHSASEYLRLHCVQDGDDLASFHTEQAMAGVRAFARRGLA